MKKAYRIRWREEGRGPWTTRTFRTLAGAQAYIRERWQGPEYMDGADGFHTDYCTYRLSGFILADVGRRQWVDDCPEWTWTDLAPATLF